MSPIEEALRCVRCAHALLAIAARTFDDLDRNTEQDRVLGAMVILDNVIEAKDN